MCNAIGILSIVLRNMQSIRCFQGKYILVDRR